MVAGGGAEGEVMKARRVVEATFALRLEEEMARQTVSGSREKRGLT